MVALLQHRGDQAPPSHITYQEQIESGKCGTVQNLGSPVIVLDDITHCPDGCQVLVVAVRVDVVEGLGGAGIPVGTCEVDGDLGRIQERTRVKIQQVTQRSDAN